MATALVACLVAVLLCPVPAARAKTFCGTLRKSDDAIVVTTGVRGVVRSLVVGATLTCENGRSHFFHHRIAVRRPRRGELVTNLLVPSRNAAGRFTATYFVAEEGASGTSFSITGKVTARIGRPEASGTIALTADVLDASDKVTTTCRTGAQKWSAVSLPGTVYAGATSQDEPLVLWIDSGASGRSARVKYFIVGWHLFCSDGRPLNIADRLEAGHGPFALDRRGAFSQNFTYTQDDGTAIDYAVSATVGDLAATGTFSATVHFVDNSATCTTGPLKWKASTL